MPRSSAKIRKRRNARKKDTLPLDGFSEKSDRGRPRKIQPNSVRGKADNYRDIFELIWDRVGPGLVKASTREEVAASFNDTNISPGYALEFVRMADLILQIVRDPNFPKQQREAQINFLADSLGAQGVVTPRRSRDICATERARIQNAHKIIRYEVWIECSCGYKGKSKTLACSKCEAGVPIMSNFNLPVEFDV